MARKKEHQTRISDFEIYEYIVDNYDIDFVEYPNIFEDSIIEEKRVAESEGKDD